MWLRVLSITSQTVIVVLGLFLLANMATKQSSSLALEALETQLNEKMDRDRESLTKRIDSLKEELQTYQQTRESRAVAFADRMEKLELLASINNSNKQQSAPNDLKTIIDNNLSYLEGRVNGVAENLDKSHNQLNSRIVLIEEKVQSSQTSGQNTRSMRNVNIINNTNTIAPLPSH